MVSSKEDDISAFNSSPGFQPGVFLNAVMKMHAFTQLSISSIISRLRLVLTPILAFLLLREGLKTTEYLGIIVVFGGLSLVISSPNMHKDKGVKFAFMSSFILSLMSIILKKASEIASIPIIAIFQSIPTIIGFPLIMKDSKIRIIKSLKVNSKEILISTLFNTFAMYFLILAMKIGPVSKVVSVYQAMMIFAVLAGVILLNERQMAFRKILGSIITLFGIIVIS